MVKKLVCTTALLVALAFLFTGLALAQRPAPTATIHEQGLQMPSGGNRTVPPGLVPAFCSPCLFYGGDGDPSNINADGLWDNNSSFFGIAAQVYSPFVVPKKTDKCGGTCKWGVSGLFVALELNPFIAGTGPAVTPSDAVWAIYSAGVVSGGSPLSATKACSGTDTAPTFTDTGRLYFGIYEEFAMNVKVTGCTLAGTKSGATFWEQVTPEFPATGFQLSYESNIPDTPPPNAFGGPEPADQSFFYGPAFGFTSFTNANMLGPFHLFSAGVEGTLVKK